MRLFRSPALHFLCLGACLFAGRTWWQVTPVEASASDDDLLYREAVALRVDASDPAVRERLARLGGFVGEDTADEASLEARARELGLARSDLVVRRHLVQMMRLAAERLEPEDVPTEDDVAARAATLTLPPRTRFTQVYLSRTRRGAHIDEDAARLLGRLRGGDGSATSLGDGFALGPDVGPTTDADLDLRFGAGFAAALASAPVGAWAGPIASSYGLHVVRVTERIAATTPAPDAVRGRVVHEILRERRDVRASERLAALRRRDVP